MKQLSNHLSHFPSLLPPSEGNTNDVIVGMAARCLLETIPRKGFSCEHQIRFIIGAHESMSLLIYYAVCLLIVPDKGGVYLILQGSVEKTAKDESTQQLTSDQVEMASDQRCRVN